jgi:PAS domain S-box-containing protein
MDRQIRILILEDDASDAELMQRELRKAGVISTVKWAQNEQTFLRTLCEFVPDLILADYALPGFDGLTALRMARQRFPDIPGIIVSGAIGEEVAIETLKAGATDYVLKQRLGRLGPAVRRTLQEVEQLAERKRAERALRESEERFRLLVEAVKDYAILMLDRQGRVVTWNAGAERIKGYTAEQIIGQHISRFYLPQDVAAGSPQQALAIAAERGQFAEEGWRVRRDGSRFWASVTITAVRDQAGTLCGFAKVTRDLTERKRAEEQLKQLNASLEQRVAERTAEAQQRADQLQALAAQLAQAEQKERHRLAEILHDHLQQLLVGCKFHLGMVRSEQEDRNLRQALDEVDGLLDQSLDASRSLTIDLCPPILHRGNMAQVLRWLAEWMRSNHGLQVHVQSDEEADPESGEVRMLLFQSVRELLFNVVKHAHVNEAVVELSRPNDHCVQVVVRDNGAGFDPSGSQIDSRKGSGFGLFTIRERLDWLGGSLRVESLPGAGTRATLTAPLRLTGPTGARRATSASGGSPVPDAVVAARAAASCAGRKTRVLLVDDHAVMRDGLARLLQGLPDMQVVGQAGDGQQAVDLALVLKPDVVLMDVSMPVMDGKEATRQILARLPRVGIIGLSMFSEPDVAEAMKAAGAVRYLAKTSPPADLVAAIRTCVAS